MTSVLNLARKSMVVIAIEMALAMCANAQAAQQECSNESLTGAFGFLVSGTNVAANLLFAISGRFVADGKGSFAGTASESTAGQIAEHYPFTGSYTVAPDCTGSAQFVFPSGGSSRLDFVVVSDGDEVIILDVDFGTVESGTAKKQFRRSTRQQPVRNN